MKDEMAHRASWRLDDGDLALFYGGVKMAHELNLD